SLSEASCETAVEFKPTTVADHILEANYPGDNGAHSDSHRTLTVAVKPEPNKTKTELSCKATTLNAGETTQCTAIVTDEANKGAATTFTGDTVPFVDKTEEAGFPQTPPVTCTLEDIPSSTQARCAAELDFAPTTIATHNLEATYPGHNLTHLSSKGTLSVL